MTTPRIMKAILGLVTVGLCTVVKANPQSSPTVDLNLVAPWSAPNFVVEVAETLATYNETAYFDFISDFIRLEEQSSSLTPYQLYQEAVKKVAAVLGRDESNFFKLSLALHEAAPRIEAYNKFYQESVKSSIDDSCDTWVQVGDRQYCDFKLFNEAMHQQHSEARKVDILPFDHVVYSKKNKTTTPTVVLYTDRFSSEFGQFYDYLTQAASFHDLSFIIRYKPRINASASPLYLSGYGVEMVLKKTDYLVIDDRSSQKASTKNQIKDKVANIGKKIGHSLFQTKDEPTIEPLTPSEIYQLDYKAAQFLANSNKPLETFVQLLQDFPKYAKSISQVEINRPFEEELMDNQGSFLRAGMNAVWLNGKGLEHSQLDPFYLVRAVRSERQLIKAFEELGFTPKEAIDVISYPGLSKADQFDDASMEEVYDVRDNGETQFITWWNDLEKDSRYSTWSSNIREMLKPVFPGQLHPIRRNVFNLILVEDLSRVESLNRVVNEIQGFIKRLIPVHFGIVAVNKENGHISTMMGQSLNYLVEEYGKGNGMKFLTTVLETIRSEGKRHPTEDDIQMAFEKTVSSAGKPKSKKSKKFQDALESQEEYAQASRNFLKRMGIVDISPENGIMFFNGKILEFSEERPWVQMLMPSLSEATRYIQSMVMNGKFEDDLDFYNYVLSQPGVLRHRNSFIVPSNTYPLQIKEFKHVHTLKYLSYDGETTPNTNLWIITNLNSKSGLKLVSDALLFAETTPNVRLALIHNPNTQTQALDEVSIPIIKENIQPSFSELLGSLIYSEENSANILQLKELITYALESTDLESNTATSNQERIIPGSPIIEMVAKDQSKKWENLFNTLENDGLDKSFHGIVINGRIVGPFDNEVEFTIENLKSLYNYEFSKRISPIQEAISEVDYRNTVDIADVIAKVTYLVETDKSNVPKALLEDSEPVYRNRVYRLITNDKHTRLVIGDPDNSFLEIGMIIDPLSETAQKWVPIISTLAELEGVSVIMYLNPENGLEELPLKRFYRYVFDKEPHFDPATGAKTIPTAYFADLPVEPLYTLGVETTNAWHVTVREANMDLDNILLTSLKEETSVSVLYELESILIEGHCIDSANKQPPRGLEFEIATIGNHTETKDTLVMANLGYFQLKALPGIWNLGLREGPSATIYSIEDIGTEGKWNYDAVEKHKEHKGPLALASFEGLTVFPLVRKNPGMESENVLDSTIKRPSPTESGFWSSFTHKIMGKKESEEGLVGKKAKQAEINIFSVASGKLYERFLSIMIASVMKHTESTVKFWFIENFLSPEFKDFVPHLAKQYNFEYEMVTYKWPAWLRAQTEKQRTIWGYKILFLDVLFPLSLDKVIFVDADQIVRTDLKELVDMDLQGAPYGYTPFCSDRTEMDGFRFWKDGYWKNHLRGRPYHISALYVVDLARFRQLAAGDRLRAQYQQLSADPNSLANLDQDLPNNMIHSVPIFSLPQEWLWCETWCSDESLKKAKTIDLCNNPLTKEPKLDRARRQVPEWETYDKEIDALRKRISTESVIISNDLGEQHVISGHVKDEL